MAIVVDTCSLVMIAKNYLPLDKDGQLYSFLEEAFSRKDLMLLDVILDESKRTSKGIAVEKMPFLKDKKLVIPTKDLFPCAPERFSNMIDNNFCVRLKKQELTEEEYIEQKEEYLKTGDAKIIILDEFCTDLLRFAMDHNYRPEVEWKRYKTKLSSFDVRHMVWSIATRLGLGKGKVYSNDDCACYIERRFASLCVTASGEPLSHNTLRNLTVTSNSDQIHCDYPGKDGLLFHIPLQLGGEKG